MTDSTASTPSDAGWLGRQGSARDALIGAAKRLLPDRSPSTITGRELAAEAGVNYGLVHHHFGGKDGALAAGLGALRDDFMEANRDAANLPLLTNSDPYLKALVRSNVDYPDSIAAADGEFPIGADLVAAVVQRISDGEPDHDSLIEAKARAIAMVSIQLCFSVFGPVLLDAVGVRHRERDEVEAALSALYDSLARTTAVSNATP